jgi:hypothetical protein
LALNFPTFIVGKIVDVDSNEKKVEKVMVSDSTNTKKTNNCLSPQIIEHRKGQWHVMLKI